MIEERECNQCKLTKPLKDFGKESKSKDGLKHDCKVCRNKAAQVDRLTWTDEHKERENQRNIHRYATTRKSMIQVMKVNADRITENDMNRRKELKLKHKFGMTPEQYNQMLRDQDYKCITCKKEESVIDWRTKVPKRLAVDHDHETGKIRGLMCSRCNPAFGLVYESIEILWNMIMYKLKNTEEVKQIG